MIGLYVPGDSVVHRLPTGFKLVILVAAGVGLSLIREPWQLGAAVAVVLIGYATARIGWRRLGQQLRPVGLLLAITFGLHVATTGWWRALLVVGSIVVLVLLAALITLTTRTSDLVDVVERAAAPLRRLGVPAERVGLLVALAIRCVPVVAELAAEIRDAQRARGTGLDVRGFAVTFVVRSLRYADTLGEALTARGLDD